MEKIGCSIGILIAIFVTVLVLTTDIGDFKHTVTFSSQELAIHAETDTGISSTDTKISSSDTNISNTDTKFNNADTNIKNNDLHNKNIITADRDLDAALRELGTSNTNYQSAPIRHENRNANYDNNGKLNTSSPTVNRSDIQNLKKGLRPSEKLLTPNKTNTINNQKNDMQNQDIYAYESISWNNWRSNFINRITDDSVKIPELDDYPRGTMFYYSFNVDNTGRVYNVKVTSLQLSKADKEKVAQMIRNYSYKEITKFPKNSKRVNAKVSAILLFADSTEYAKPSDFHDLEHIKTKVH